MGMFNHESQDYKSYEITKQDLAAKAAYDRACAEAEREYNVALREREKLSWPDWVQSVFNESATEIDALRVLCRLVIALENEDYDDDDAPYGNSQIHDVAVRAAQLKGSS